MGEDENKKRERRHQEDLERLRGFRPIDDTFMRGLFKENIPLAELVLRIITGKPDLVLLKCETQADMKRVTGARSVCLDAYATDSTGKKYDIEVQRSDNGADPHRARYHSSMLDIEYRDNSDIGRLMHGFNCINASDMYFDLLAEKTRYLKENPKGVSEMCKVMEDLRNESYAEGHKEGRAEGRAEGREEQAKATAVRMKQKGLSLEDIADSIGFGIETVKNWLTPKAV